MPEQQKLEKWMFSAKVVKVVKGGPYTDRLLANQIAETPVCISCQIITRFISIVTWFVKSVQKLEAVKMFLLAISETTVHELSSSINRWKASLSRI